MSKVKWKPGTILAPVPPAMVTCGTMENSNIITIAWTGIINSSPPMTYISVRPERFSHSIIKEKGEFVINLTSSSLVRKADFCGVSSGKDVDKFEKCNLEKEPMSIVSAPGIAQSPISIECKVKEIISLGSHDMFMAEILAVHVDDKYISPTGKLRIEQCSLVAYAHGSYYAFGKKIGQFGYSVKKKREQPQRRNKDKK